MYQDLIDFWFSEDVAQYWFNSTQAFDLNLTNAYEGLWRQAKNGELDEWQQTPTGCLALVIILDQFPLNMFRGTAKSFSTESLSRIIARSAVEKAYDQELPTKQKSFIYMPFMHSENLDDQAFSVELFSQPGQEDNLRFAKHHHDIVKRFGRFPHRNIILGRKSSEAEVEYLNSKQGFQG